jgi:hypothetical protein
MFEKASSEIDIYMRNRREPQRVEWQQKAIDSYCKKVSLYLHVAECSELLESKMIKTEILNASYQLKSLS